MTYTEAIMILRDASGIQNGRSLTDRLDASPGRLGLMDTSTAGSLPEGESFADDVLRALLTVRRHIAGQKLVEKELTAILIEISAPIRLLGADPKYANTRIPQLSMILSLIAFPNSAIASAPNPALAKGVPWYRFRPFLISFGISFTVFWVICFAYFEEFTRLKSWLAGIIAVPIVLLFLTFMWLAGCWSDGDNSRR